MRILHVVPTYIPATRYGGPIYSVHGLAKGQAALGHDVHVFTTNVDGSGRSAVPTETPIVLDGVSITYFPVAVGRRLYRSPALGRAIAAQISSFDVVHLQSVFLWPTYVAARAAAKFGIPYILSPRGMLVKQLVAQRSRIIKSTWIRFVERRNIEQAAAIHVTSRLESADLRDFGFRLPDVIEIANGVEPPEPYDIKDVADDIRAAVERGAYILFLGRLNWKKNLRELVCAWREIRHARLIIAGNQEHDYAAELVAVAHKEGVSDQVSIIARPVLGADKEFLFKGCIAFTLPSLSENFGNTVLEAMVRGKAVVATETTGAAAIVKAANCGFICAPNAISLARSIQRVLANSNELTRMGDRGRTAALGQYSWECVARKMVAAYRPYCQKNKAPRRR